MTRSWPLLCALLVAACGPDASHTVNVSPAAEFKMETILGAVDKLYTASGVRFAVRSVDDSERRDDEIIVRIRDSFPDEDFSDGWHQGGHTRATRRGIIVWILPDADERTIAHELVHAAGVRGHPTTDPEFLMSERGHGWLIDGPTIQKMR